MTASSELAITTVDARALTDQIKVGVEACWQLITRAYTERAWAILGYSSWDDYCTREFGTSRLRLPREERSEVVSSLRESGLSVRAIAAATGISKNTVTADLAEVSQFGTPADAACDGKCATDECVCPDADEIAEGLIVAEQSLPPLPENYMNAAGGVTESTPGQTDRVAEALAKAKPEPKPVTGIDGKTYPSKPTSPPAQKKAPTRRPLVDSARDLGLDIAKIAKRIEDFGADDRLVRNKTEVAPRLRNHLDYAIKVCQDLNQQLTRGV